MPVLPKPLQDSIKSGKLIAFVGAGVSRGVGLPSWYDIVKGLLEDKKGYINKAEPLLNAMENEILNPLDVLDRIEDDKKYVYEYFENELGKEKKCDLLKKIDGLVAGYVTTNFDNLIEKNCNIAKVLTKDNHFRLSSLGEEKPFLLKLHGDVGSIDDCVIFSNQYKEMYSKENLASFKMKKIFSEYNVVFIGFSFDDPYVRELFEYVGTLLDGMGPKHYIISKNDLGIDNIECLIVDDYKDIPSIFDGANEFMCDSEKEIINLEEAEGFEIKVDGNDLPPDVDFWVGRERELKLLDSDDFKVVFITGFGGEGKSALASHYINQSHVLDGYDVVVWKDFKEEDHKFNYKIISMILDVSAEFDIDKLVGLEDKVLVDIFFEKLSNKKLLFVLDNVDSYIDLDSFEPVGGVGYFFNKALDNNHKSKFVFTCRPFIRCANVDLIQFPLSGLTEPNTIDYFSNSGLPISSSKIETYAKKSFSLTHGHALWLSLILAQARRGEKALDDFLKDIESGVNIEKNDSTILSEKVLNCVWASLHSRDKILLRTLAEAVRAETEYDYSEIVKGELNYKNFNKALKALKNLNLIISKRDSDYIELHPLVKEYVRKNYQGSDRNKYISLLIDYYGKFVLVLQPKLSYKMSFDEFSNFVNQAELYINSSDYQNAISILREVHSAMNAAGYVEEYLRVSKRLFSSFSWSKKRIAGLVHFEPLLEWTLRSAIEYGDRALSDELISKYEALVENKEESYIRLMYIKSYKEWFLGNYKEAISLCDEAIYLLKRAGQEDKFGIEHNRALALRDSQGKDNIRKAMDFFLGSYSIDDLLEGRSDCEDGSVYGNLGKCLYLLGEHKSAIASYCRSFTILFDSEDSYRMINVGYASLWLAEALLTIGSKDAAFYFYKLALEYWKSSSPVLANSHATFMSGYSNNSTYKSIISQELWRAEQYCTDWVDKQLTSV